EVPFPSVVLEFPDQFLLFRVYRDHRLAPSLERQDDRVDMLELSVPIRMVASFFRLPVALQAVSRRLEQPAHGASTDSMPLSCKFRGQLRGAFASPPQWRLRVAARDWIDQAFQGGLQLRIGFRSALSSRPRLPQPSSACSLRFALSRVQFGETSGNRVS